MLLGNKKSQSNEQNWCIILSPLRNELDKKKVAQKIVDAFALSVPEAADLVANTPIILLDNLTRQIATQVKDFFASAGAEVNLTNDVVMKRKCYRTVWPEQPSLSFLNTWNAPVDSPQEDRLELAAQEALNELRSIGQEDAKKSFSADFPPSGLFAKEKEKMMEEVELWRQECLKLREDTARLNKELAQLRKDNPVNLQSGKDMQQSIKDKEREMQEARQFARMTQEKYDALREEYREARSLFEEKVASESQDNDRFKLKVNELNESIQNLQKDKKALELLLRDKEAKLQKTEQEYAQYKQSVESQAGLLSKEREFLKAKEVQLTEGLETAGKDKKRLEESLRELEQKLQKENDEHSRFRQLTEEKIGQVTRENEAFRIKQNEMTEKLLSQAKEKDIVANSLREREMQMEQSTEESLRLRQGLEDRLAQARRETDQQKKHLQEALDFSDSLKRAKENLERTVQNGIAQIGEWREKYSELTRRLENAEKTIQDEQRLRAIAEGREKEFERNQVRLISELEMRNAGLRDLELKCQELDTQVQDINALLHEREKVLSSNLHILESREKELESLRRQIRDMNSQIEHREAMARKNQVTGQLVEKESEFKRLIGEQEKIEREIRDKEEAMRQVLSRQEAIEKEIMEAKQVQRHIMERFKQKEKPALKLKVQRDQESIDQNDPRDNDLEP